MESHFPIYYQVFLHIGIKELIRKISVNENIKINPKGKIPLGYIGINGSIKNCASESNLYGFISNKPHGYKV